MARNLEDFITNNFKKALNRREIQVFYQPVIRTYSRKVCSFEALARWIDPEIGMIYPDEFIPLLEREHAIHQLDATILRQVCERSGAASTMGRRHFPFPSIFRGLTLDSAICSP